MQRLLLRGGAVAIVVVTFIAAGFVGASAIRAKVDDAANRANENDSSRRAARIDISAPATASDSDGAGAARPPMVAASVGGPAAARTSSPASTSPSRQPATAARAAASVNPAIAMGRTDLPDSVIALRGDTDVVVSFDVPMVRTRRPDKFEQFVRTTLPLIYGGAAREALSKIPQGGLASQGDLLAELPRKGLRISLGYEWAIRLFPETRPGQDGPIVVRYRASVVPAGR